MAGIKYAGETTGPPELEHGEFVWTAQPHRLSRAPQQQHEPEVYGRRIPELPSFSEDHRGVRPRLLAVFSVMPYEFNTRTPEISRSDFRTGIGMPETSNEIRLE